MSDVKIRKNANKSRAVSHLNDQAHATRPEEDRFARAALDGLNAHIAILDDQGVILAVNRTWRDFAAANSPLCGSLAEGANYLTVCDGARGDGFEDAQTAAEGIRAVLSGQKDYFRMEYPCHSPTERRWFELRVTPMPAYLSGAIVCHENITERVLAEEAVRRSEEHYATTLRSIGDAVITTDARGRVTFLNGVGEQLTGWRQTEVFGRDNREVLQIRGDITYEEVESPVASVIQTGEVIALANPVTLIAKDGREVPIEDSAAPVRDRDGNLVGVVMVFRDVTDRRRIDGERERHLAEIESLNARLRRAMAETHHRVKNNLQIIASLVDLQLLNAGEMVPAVALQRIGQHVGTLASIHDLLTQEARNGGELNFISARAALEKLLPLLQATVGERRIRFRADDAPISVKDGAALSVLVNELVSNAAKHGQGDIELTLSALPSSLKPRGGREETERMALLEVCDDGPGFPEGFDPQSAARTGLDLVESVGRWDLNGEIVYTTREEGGGRVIVSFPLPDTQQKQEL